MQDAGEVILYHVNPNVRGIGQKEAMRRSGL
jgi:hypothetical protein